MFSKKSHVGRPSNEELKQRRNRKMIMIALPVSLIVVLGVLISTGSLSNLMGNTVTDYYCSDNTYTLQGSNCVKTISKKAYLLADVNSDYIIDNNDLNVLNEYVKDETKTNMTEMQLKIADINQDGMINEIDVQILENYFTKVAGTYAGYSEKIGVDKYCEEGYTLNGDMCEIKNTIPAEKKVVSENNGSKKEVESVGSNENNNSSINNNTNINNNNSINNNSNNTTNPVIATLKPEDNETNLKVYRKYKIYVNFDIKDTSKEYYYVWRNYLYGENNYSTECKKVISGDHYGAFTMIGTRKVEVTVYSDASCKNAVTKVDSKTYTCIGCQNMVDVTFKPQNNKTTAAKGTKYKLNVNFHIKEKNNSYYYIWSNYLNGSNNYNTKCTKVTEGDHSGSFTMDGMRKVRVTLYSDSSCKNKVAHVDSNTYVCSGCDKSVDVELKPQDNKTSFTKGTKYKMNVSFKLNDKENNYYYIWSNYLNGSNNYNTKCTKVTEGDHAGTFTVDGTKKVSVNVYSDASCKNKIKTVESKNYTCSNCIPLTISIGKNLSSSQTKGTIIHNGILFNVNDKGQTYYYRWRTYKGGELWVEGDCNKIISHKEYSKDLTIIDIQSRKGTITVYSDNKCSKRVDTVPVAQTTEYKCSNCPPLTISIGRNLSSSQIKGTIIHNGIVFNVIEKGQTYYYKWRTYKGNEEHFVGGCYKVISNKKIVKDLTIIDNDTRKGIITVYSDSSCSRVVNTVPVAQTTEYKCSNCNIKCPDGWSDGGKKTCYKEICAKGWTYDNKKNRCWKKANGCSDGHAEIINPGKKDGYMICTKAPGITIDDCKSYNNFSGIANNKCYLKK